VDPRRLVRERGPRHPAAHPLARLDLRRVDRSDYRLAPAARYPDPIDDVRAALAFLRGHGGRYGYDEARIGTWGESAGGLLALLAAFTMPGVSAVVGWYPVTDVLALPMFAGATNLAAVPEFALFGAPPHAVAELAREASPITHVTPAAPPCLLVHGEADPAVPAAQSRSLHEQLQAARADSTLHIVPGAGHCFEHHPDIPALINEAVDFLAAHLEKEG
jgi:acetyl esterase/lipase